MTYHIIQYYNTYKPCSSCTNDSGSGSHTCASVYLQTSANRTLVSQGLAVFQPEIFPLQIQRVCVIVLTSVMASSLHCYLLSEGTNPCHLQMKLPL
jgi:hypothetical protein